jgi:hypothetical protein
VSQSELPMKNSAVMFVRKKGNPCKVIKKKYMCVAAVNIYLLKHNRHSSAKVRTYLLKDAAIVQPAVF